MRYTTSAPPVDLAAVVPEISAYARTTVRLHPRSGRPGLSDSHIGGPLWWPADEPWPTCTEPYVMRMLVTLPDGRRARKKTTIEPDEPNPMVPVAQLWRHDFPEIDFPEDTDVLQVLWCPNDHNHPGWWGPAFRLEWRRTEPGTALLNSPPDPLLANDDYLPQACSLHPERVVEYPDRQVYPPELRERLRQWEIAHYPTTPHEGRDAEHLAEYGCGCYQYQLSVAPGCKIGGWTSWHSTDLYAVPCNDCGGATRELLKLDSCEWYAAPRWEPVIDSGAPLPSNAEPQREPTGLSDGIWGALTLFTCRTDPRHAPRFTYQP